MSSHFKRIALNIDVQRLEAAPRRLVQVSDDHNRDRYPYTRWQPEAAAPTPLLMYALPDDVVEGIIAQLPPSLMKRERPSVHLMAMPKPCPESRSLPPHVDRGRRCAINVYLACGGEVTEFYDADEKACTLSLVDSFIAKPGEAWLLDVSKPHAVMMREAKERLGLTISFRRVKFAEMAAMLSAA